jgi:predicted ATP-dependent Lon-type protease
MTTSSSGGVLTATDEKVLQDMADRVVYKPLTSWNDAYKEFPRYVLEYLCARYCEG